MMTSISQAAVAASVIVGLVSVPAVSQTTDSTRSAVESGVPNVSSGRMPSEVSFRSTEDGFHGSLQTAVTDFSSYISPGSANASLESSSARVEVERTPESTVWTMNTPSGDLRLESSATSEIEVVETPYGTLRTRISGGDVSRTFEGENRSRVKEISRSLRSRLEEKREVMKQKAGRFGKRPGASSGSVDLVANASTASGYGNNSLEHVLIVNEGSSINIDGWEISNNNPSGYEFGSNVLEPGERLKVYTQEVDEQEAVTGTGLTWENGGDKATLKNAENETVAVASY
ncbi:MAG: lamin tail domain-containing protein [Candidatus Nanohaloarchaea archaeon]